jgi:hypothetical protein
MIANRQFHEFLPAILLGSRGSDSTCLVSRAGSTGRCNTIQCVDSAMLARQNHLFGCTRSKPSQSSVPAGLNPTSDFGFCFQCQAGSSLVLHRPIETTLLFGPSCPKPLQSNRNGCLSRPRPPTLPSTSRFRHCSCSFIWAEIAEGVFTREDWSVFSARMLAHKSAAKIGRACLERAKANPCARAPVARPSEGRE